MTNIFAILLRRSAIRQRPIRPSVSGPLHVPRCARGCEYGHCTALAEVWFNRVLSLERKRSERSRVPFILALLKVDRKSGVNGHPETIVENVMGTLAKNMRETDIMGWYRNGEILGAIFTELGHCKDVQPALNSLRGKLSAALEQTFASEWRSAVHISWHVFPEISEQSNPPGRLDAALYPEKDEPTAWLRSTGKRTIDIIGSTLALLLLSPLFVAVACAVRMSSPGPILFRQQRIGQFGRPFTFLKFRTMKVQNSSRIHELYVKKLISGAPVSGQDGVFKIQNDPRVTRIGNFLRKASLDELPQFWNVLKGEMSLVGPRPPIPYEAEMYDLWHRRRFLGAKPGITGLWQVTGRSRTTFAEMVRLDLRYVESCSPWLDLKILWQTPVAVVTGSGAY